MTCDQFAVDRVRYPGLGFPLTVVSKFGRTSAVPRRAWRPCWRTLRATGPPPVARMERSPSRL